MNTNNQYLEFSFNLETVNISPPKRSKNEFPGFNQKKFISHSINGQIKLDKNHSISNAKCVFKGNFAVEINKKVIRVNNFELKKVENKLIINSNGKNLLHFDSRKLVEDRVLGKHCIWNVSLKLTKYARKYFNTDLNNVGSVSLLLNLDNSLSF